MSRLSILIVDDRPENLLTLECLLDQPELDIVRAGSGQEALEKTLDNEFALVLLDVQMPGMDGYETAELMRGNQKTMHIPIIFVTAARKEQDHVFKGYHSGAVDYLFKPLEPAMLISKVNVFLELHRQKTELEQKTRELDAKIVELEELQQQLEESNEKLRKLSALDGLTGIPNRRSFDERYSTEWKRAVRQQEPLSLILLDIDYFKAYNDHYGHLAGDVCLRQVAKTVQQALFREVDVVCRYGGEEFILILPNTDTPGAVLVAERILEGLDGLNIPHEGVSEHKTISASQGIATRIPQPDEDADQLLEQADQALYAAKEKGRARYHVYTGRHHRPG
jgi:diguanylate cyclase (GGDEF)-like protein